MTTMTKTRKEESDQVIRDIINPQFHQLHLKVEDYLKFRPENPIKLDKDSQICRAALNGHCPLGAKDCPLRHTNPSPLNFQSPQQAQNQRDPRLMSTVCKHWLRGLCKKSDACEFLHEYNLRRMPICWWYAKNGFCSAGEECLYAHPKGSQVECPDYNRGFCKLGPDCPRKHVRRVICQLYLNGFCPAGPSCPQGHPKPTLPPPEAYEPLADGQRDLGPPPPNFARFGDYNQTIHRPDGSTFVPRRNLDEVMCFKCGQYGHYANQCRNRNVPGNRGGIERGLAPLRNEAA
ncbi:hypothetical protein CPB86DRAFT_782246 [Serendipita vermifera]|nr:hypothetical protein CPB86DRAFT_782246 [Serendipita vermifera]